MVNIVTKQLNVTHLLGFPIDINGNLQRALFEAIHIAKHGVKVNFVVSEEVVRKGILIKSLPRSFHDKPNIKVFSVKSLTRTGAARSVDWPNVSWRINNLVALPIEALRLTHAYNETIIHVHAPTPVVKPFAASLVKKLSNNPMVLDLHDPWSGHPFPILGFFDILLRNGMMRYAINNADMIVTAHTSLTNLVRKINNRKPVTLIPNGVDTEIFRPRPRNLELMKTLGIDPEDPVILFSGHITEEKGLDTLVYAAKTVVRQYKNIKFLVIGAGPIRNRIEALLDDVGLRSFFKFTGFIRAEMLAQHLSLANICVAPYKPLAFHGELRIETPIKVVQYLSAGKPVIMSRVSDENVVSWSGGGLLVDPGDPKKLAEDIICLIQDERFRERMGRKGREYVERNLDWSTIAQRLVDIYKSLL